MLDSCINGGRLRSTFSTGKKRLLMGVWVSDLSDCLTIHTYRIKDSPFILEYVAGKTSDYLYICLAYLIYAMVDLVDNDLGIYILVKVLISNVS